MAALSVVARRNDFSFVSVSEHALDGSWIELWTVGEDDDRCFHIRSKRAEPAAEARTGPALPVLAAPDGHVLESEAVEWMGAFDDDDLVNR
jgi:hypothetical protein